MLEYKVYFADGETDTVKASDATQAKLKAKACKRVTDGHYTEVTKVELIG